MCLASRLSTQANLGNMTTSREILSMVVGNIALVQVQAIVASFIVAVSVHRLNQLATVSHLDCFLLRYLLLLSAQR